MDLRGGGRAVRVTAHAEAGFLVLSTWKADECVSTVRLLPDEASELIAGIAAGLAHLVNGMASPVTNDQPWSTPRLDERLRELEQRLASLESHPR